MRATVILDPLHRGRFIRVLIVPHGEHAPVEWGDDLRAIRHHFTIFEDEAPDMDAAEVVFKSGLPVSFQSDVPEEWLHSGTAVKQV